MFLFYKFRVIRYLFTITRLVYFALITGNLKSIKESKDAIQSTSSRNKESMLSFRDCYSGQRSKFFLNNLKTIKNKNEIKMMDILIVGPRNEGELFNFYANNFNPEKVDAIDLFTYSPKIKLLDVSDLKKKTKKYDLIYLGFMIAYQKNPKVLIDNLKKSLKPEGLVAVSGELVDKNQFLKTTFTQFKELTEVDNLFDSHYQKILLEEYTEELFYFRKNAKCYCGIYKI